MTVLIMTTVLSMMVIALYVSVRGGLLAASLQSKRVAAGYVAEAGLAETMENLRAGGFTLTSGQLTGAIGSGGTYTVDFKDSPPFGTHDSINNLNNAAFAANFRAVDGVPPNSAVIIVRAEVGGVERVLEAVVSRGGGSIIAANAIQGGGNILMAGDVKVDGITDLDDPTPVPGNIHSNASSGVAVAWDNTAPGSNANITGAVGALGGSIDLAGYTPAGGSSVTGTAASFPSLDIAGTISSKAGSPSPSINPVGTTALGGGDFYQSGDVVVNGDLKLDGTNLHISGDLQVNGSISGEGTIFVGGESRFYGDATVSADPDQKVALMSHGSVTLSGFDGNQYLAAVGATDSDFADRWSDLQMVLQDMQSTMNSSPMASLQAGGSNHTLMDEMRRSIGQTAAGPTYNSTEHNLVGNLSATLQTQAPGPTRDFLVKKLNNIKAIFESCMDNPQVVGMPNDGVARQILIDAWKNDPELRNMEFIGIFDATIDNGDASVMKDLINITQQIDYDKVGAGYFQGLVYTNGYVHAQNEINVIGALMAKGDPALPSASLNGQTVKPGDLLLEDGVRVTFVEKFFDGQAGGISVSGADTLGMETWLGR